MVMSCMETSIPKYVVMEIKITGKRKKGQPRKSWEECVKKDLKQYGLRREDVLRTIERNAKNVLEQELLTLASQDNGIKTDVAVAVVGGLFAPSCFPPHQPQSPILNRVNVNLTKLILEIGYPFHHLTSWRKAVSLKTW